MSFSHLHVHTTYSIGDGLCKIKDLFEEAKKLGQPGLAITDHAVMSGVPEFLNVAKKYPEIKPVVGCEIHLTDGFDHRIKDMEHFKWSHLTLLAKNLIGYRNLCKIVSTGFSEGMYLKPRVSREVLERYHEGIIVLSGCLGSEIACAICADDMAKAEESALWFKKVFGEDFYLEVLLHDSGIAFTREVPIRQEKVCKNLFSLGERLGIKVVATNDVHFVHKSDFLAQDILCRQMTGATLDDENRLRYTGEEYLKSEEEMFKVFPGHPEALAVTDEILDKVEKYDVCSKWKLPHPFDVENSDAHLRISYPL